MNKDIKPRNEQGQPHGYWEYYFPDGQLMYKGDYVNGKRHGHWEYYYYNGQLYCKGNYVNGKEHGYWEVYYFNEQLNYKGKYINGFAQGYFLEYRNKSLYKFFYKNGVGYYKNRYITNHETF